MVRMGSGRPVYEGICRWSLSPTGNIGSRGRAWPGQERRFHGGRGGISVDIRTRRDVDDGGPQFADGRLARADRASRRDQRSRCSSKARAASGKELVARQIHTCSRRYRGPLVAVNCAALVETLVEAELFGIEERTATGVRGRRGKFELADQGTLFLDEVGDLSATAQAKLLRVLQDMAVERVGGHGAASGGHARRRGDEPQPAGDGGCAAVSRRSLLPPRRRRDLRAAAPRAARGHPAARRSLHQPVSTGRGVHGVVRGDGSAASRSTGPATCASSSASSSGRLRSRRPGHDARRSAR